MAVGVTLFEGAWEEAVRHPDIIPGKAHIRIVEVEDAPDEAEGQTLGERFGERFGTLSFEPVDGSENFEKYLEGMGSLPESRLRKI